jgi:hypothetical protein
MTRGECRIVVEASFADKVRAINSLVEFYRRRLPERVVRIERSASPPGQPDAESPQGTPR